MSTDPAPFLSTIILTSAALVAIVGGLLVGRFVSLDSAEQGSRQVLADALGRLAKARVRATAAYDELVLRRSRDFVSATLLHMDPGKAKDKIDPVRLRALTATALTDDELSRLVEDVADEFTRARDELVGAKADSIRTAQSVKVAEALRELPNPRWPEVWQKVYLEIAKGQDTERPRARRPNSRRLEETKEDQSARFLRAAKWSQPQTDGGEIEAITAVERARQRVEDLEEEVKLLRQAHTQIVTPDNRLWWGVGILVAFAIVGVAWPTWVMSRGPSDLATVQFFVYPFIIALGTLLLYIVVYLWQLFRRKLAPIADETGEGDVAGRGPEPRAAK